MRELVRWLVVLAEEENVTAAAERLQMAQPTLSRMLGRLEAALGTRLFDRHGRRITLNAKGIRYLEHVRRADDELAAAARTLTEDGPSAVRLGFLHSFGTWLVPETIRRSRDRDDRVVFELFQGAAADIEERVATDRLDLGLVSPRPADDRLTWAFVQRQHLHVALPRGHRLAGAIALTVAELRDETFVSVELGYGMRRILESVCAAAGFTPRIAFECQELTTVAGLVAAGIGIAILPVEDSPHYPDGLITVPLRGEETSRDIGVIWARRANLSPPVALVRDLLRRR